MLLGKPESSPLLNPAVARISWLLKNERNEELDYQHFDPPFLLAGDRILAHIRNLTVRELPGGTLFPVEMTQYDPWVIREALHNCIAHQDYGLRGRIQVVETPDYQDLIVELIRKHQPVTREDIDEMLLDKLPEVLSQEQKLMKIHNLLYELSHRQKRIRNSGSRRFSKWVLLNEPSDKQ